MSYSVPQSHTAVVPKPNSDPHSSDCSIEPLKSFFASSPPCRYVRSLAQMLHIPQYGDATLNILTSSVIVSVGSDTSRTFSDILSTSEVLENSKWFSCTPALSKQSPESSQIILFSHLGGFSWQFPIAQCSQPLATCCTDVWAESCGRLEAAHCTALFTPCRLGKPWQWEWRTFATAWLQYVTVHMYLLFVYSGKMAFSSLQEGGMPYLKVISPQWYSDLLYYWQITIHPAFTFISWNIPFLRFDFMAACFSAPGSINNVT